MYAEGDANEPRCPKCAGPLARTTNGDIGFTDLNHFHRHAYWCPAGCRGPEPDGTFGLTQCPACGGHDTCSIPVRDGMEEIECNACGTITSFHSAPTDL